MLHDQLTKNLKEGEQLVRIVRRDALAQLGASLLAAAFILGDFFLIVFLFGYRPWGIVAFCVLLFVGVILVIRIMVERQLNALLVTSERIIHVSQHGLFTRAVSEVRHENITDVKFSVKGVAQTMLGLGTVEVQTAGEGENLRLDGVRHPQEVQALITTTMRMVPRDVVRSAHGLVQAVQKLKDEYGQDAVQQVVSTLGDEDEPGR